jgi:2,3-bisphosphoglycerate-dependent phosphoglycerate mutase
MPSTASHRDHSLRQLVLVRHGESEFNAKNLFTGWTDVDLTARGIREAEQVGERLKAMDITLDAAFASDLRRTVRSAGLILERAGQPAVPVTAAGALKERDYGELTGLNKDEARARWGDEQVRLWRRSYDTAPPGGESLRDTIARVLPYFLQEILPAAMRRQSVLVVGHGNTLRGLTFVLDRLSSTEIASVEFATGTALVYGLEPDTTVRSKQLFLA